MANKNPTKLKKFHIKKFRGLEDVEIEFGDRITLICGKNGTSKSTILGVAAHIFNFEKDYSKDPPVEINHYTLNDKPFKSPFSDHFRFSEKYDTSGGMDISINLYDGYFNETVDTIKLGIYKYADRRQVRPVVRNNIPSPGGNTSRNVTHPVIYLSLSRLLPISQREKYSERSVSYLKENMTEFYRLCREILGKYDLTQVTATEGDVSSAVAHSESYDQDSVSAGEDNVGQLALALMSFQKLKEEYKDYKGGLLLIDEADAGLFPAAQKKFIRELSRIANRLSLQVILTSHSPTMIEAVKDLSEQHKSSNMYRTLYLTSTYGPIEVKENWGWERVHADLNVETYKATTTDSLPKVNVYFEDNEAVDFFNAIVRKQKLRKPLSLMKNIKLGCGNYLNLINVGITEFSSKSIIVFDGDVEGTEDKKNCILLPGDLPPDQLLFEFLFKLPRADIFWQNDIGFTRDVFLDCARIIIQRLDLSENMAVEDFSLQVRKNEVLETNNGKAIRKVFKDFYKNENVQEIIHRKLRDNPFSIWGKSNANSTEIFNRDLEKAIKGVLTSGFGIDPGKLSSISYD